MSNSSLLFSSNGGNISEDVPIAIGATSLCYRVNVGGRIMFKKVLKDDLRFDPRYLNLFKKEYELGQEMNHPNIVRYLDFKDDAKEVASGLECGISLVNFNDIQVGDIIETFTEIEVEQKL